MAPLPNISSEMVAFLQSCINKTKSVRDVHESLGLYSQTNEPRKDPDFFKTEANELYAEVKKIAYSFATSCGGGLEQLQADLARTTNFSTQIFDLGRQYGPAVWGQAESDASREQDATFEELDWNSAKDRDSILFYIHCLIASLAVRESLSTPRKAKGKKKQRTHEEPRINIVDLTGNSPTSNIPYRAPEPPRMSPIGRSCTRNLRTSTDEAEELDVSINVECDTSAEQASTSGKRKATDFGEQALFGRLPKVRKPVQQILLPLREQGGDLYAVPRSPTTPLDTVQSAGITGTWRQRESTQDTDRTYMPHGATVETGTVMDQYDASKAELESSTVTTSEVWQEKEHRRELFRLLLSHLNSIRQFSNESYETDAEERMNMLLHYFRLNDTEKLQTTLGDDFTRVHVALESWMNMRHLIGEFRSVTAYFGPPGEQWEQYLLRMPDVPCAEATLAYLDLQDLAAKETNCEHVGESFDADLARLFDSLTLIEGCNGVDAFKGIRKYNATLLEWFE